MKVQQLRDALEGVLLIEEMLSTDGTVYTGWYTIERVSKDDDGMFRMSCLDEAYDIVNVKKFNQNQIEGLIRGLYAVNNYDDGYSVRFSLGTPPNIDKRIKNMIDWEQRTWNLATRVWLIHEHHTDLTLHIGVGEAIATACEFIEAYRKITEDKV